MKQLTLNIIPNSSFDLFNFTLPIV
jgi:hypothetical protein